MHLAAKRTFERNLYGQISKESYRNHRTAECLPVQKCYTKCTQQSSTKFLYSLFLQGERIWKSQWKKRRRIGNGRTQPTYHTQFAHRVDSQCPICVPPFRQTTQRQVQFNTGFSEISALRLENQAAKQPSFPAQWIDQILLIPPLRTVKETHPL
jgi:hypothetical protein